MRYDALLLRVGRDDRSVTVARLLWQSGGYGLLHGA